MDRYKLALLFLSVAVLPLFYLNMWFGLTALFAIYVLAARFANKSFDRQFRNRAKVGKQ